MWIGILGIVLLLCWLKKRRPVPEDHWCSGTPGQAAVWDPKAPPEVIFKVAQSHSVVAAARNAEPMLLRSVNIEDAPDTELDRITVLLTIAGMLCGRAINDAAATAADHATMTIYSGALRWPAAVNAAERAIDFIGPSEVALDATMLCSLAHVLGSSRH